MQEISKIGGKVTESSKASVSKEILDSCNAACAKFDLGIEVIYVDVRGVYDPAEKVAEKILALEKPLPAEDAFGHDLPADYWEPHMTPAFFNKMTYGSIKAPRTPAAVSLEWSVPSPPDFHHFNEVF